MPETDLQRVLQFLKVLADENRLKLLGLLAHHERSVEELAAQLHLKMPTISHHLTRLKEVGLVSMRPEGNTHLYSLDAEALHSMGQGLFSSEKMASLVADGARDAWEEKVLRDFFEGTRLKEIPASRKKRAVVLKWFTTQFEHGTRYTGKQVNEIIQRHHEDSSAIRRELIGEQLMQREDGSYWLA